MKTWWKYHSEEWRMYYTFVEQYVYECIAPDGAMST